MTRLKSGLTPWQKSWQADFTFEMDVTQDSHYESMKKLVEERWG